MQTVNKVIMASAFIKNTKVVRKVRSRSQTWAAYSLITDISDEDQDGDDDPGEEKIEEGHPSSNQDIVEGIPSSIVHPESSCTSDCLVQCKHCKQNLYPQAFEMHSDLRHSTVKDSSYQSKMFQRIVAEIKEESNSKNTSRKRKQNKNSAGKLDASENKADSLQSQSNTVGDQETKAGPGHGSKSNLKTKNTSNLKDLLFKKISTFQIKELERIASENKGEPSSESTSKESEENGKDERILQNHLLRESTEENDASENKGNSFQSQNNTVDDQETKTGPDHGLKSVLKTKNESNLKDLLFKKISTFQIKELERIASENKGEPSSESTSKESEENGKDERILQNHLLRESTEENDASENKGNSFQSQNNTVDDQETKTGPDHGLKSVLKTKNESNLKDLLFKKISTFQIKELERIASENKGEPSSESTSKESEENGKDERILQNHLLRESTEENDASENKGNSFQSQNNTVDDQETKTGPDHGLKSVLKTKNESIQVNEPPKMFCNNRKRKPGDDSTGSSNCSHNSYKKKQKVFNSLRQFVAKKDYVQSNSFHDRNDRTNLVSTKSNDIRLKSEQKLKRKHTDIDLKEKKARLKLFFNSKTNKHCMQKFSSMNIKNAIAAVHDYEPLNRNRDRNYRESILGELSSSYRITGLSPTKNFTNEGQDKLIFPYEDVQSAVSSSGRKMESGLILYNKRCDHLRAAFDSEIIQDDINTSSAQPQQNNLTSDHHISTCDITNMIVGAFNRVVDGNAKEKIPDYIEDKDISNSFALPKNCSSSSGSTENSSLLNESRGNSSILNESTENPSLPSGITEGPSLPNGSTKCPSLSSGLTEGKFLLGGSTESPFLLKISKEGSSGSSPFLNGLSKNLPSHLHNQAIQNVMNGNLLCIDLDQCSKKENGNNRKINQRYRNR
ncbi:hypothetical protein TNCT_251781 [Trichonephila clavata]|uniref:Uncharacterized protein n=1 Tax=Trichonephila clavata TaxID=2740835 RepID=A0A8X6HAL0_TRICU|nr:hypothetical protein TNCT_251781 [Trichonephila clavata]